jgi:hypothetical protein
MVKSRIQWHIEGEDFKVSQTRWDIYCDHIKVYKKWANLLNVVLYQKKVQKPFHNSFGYGHLDMSLRSMLNSFTFQPLPLKIGILTNAIIVWIYSGF